MKVTFVFTTAGSPLEVTTVEVAAGFTARDSAAEVLPAKLRSPAQVAVMECEPRAKFATEIWAALLERFAAPSEVAPSKNVTAPVAWPPTMEGATVAVKITACPNDAGLELALADTVEPAGLIVSVNAAKVLAMSFASPL